MPELMAGIGHGNGLSAIRHTVPTQKLDAIRTGEPLRIEAEL
jgi:hypothetical protein